MTGAGSGIGAATARIFVRERPRVILADHRSEGIEIEAAGGEALSMQTDVRNGEQVRTIVHQTVEQFGKLDILVNKAGVRADQPSRTSRKKSSIKPWRWI